MRRKVRGVVSVRGKAGRVMVSMYGDFERDGAASMKCERLKGNAVWYRNAG